MDYYALSEWPKPMFSTQTESTRSIIRRLFFLPLCSLFLKTMSPWPVDSSRYYLCLDSWFVTPSVNIRAKRLYQKVYQGETVISGRNGYIRANQGETVISERIRAKRLYQGETVISGRNTVSENNIIIYMLKNIHSLKTLTHYHWPVEFIV